MINDEKLLMLLIAALGDTPLHFAAEDGDVDAMQLLIDRGADVNQPNNGGVTPLHFAALYDNVDAMHFLIEHGADVNQAWNNGFTPLFIAAQEGHVEAMQLLIGHGADVNQATDGGCSPLYVVARIGNEQAMQLLIDNGAVVNQLNVAGLSPLHIALLHQNVDTAELLINEHANPNEPFIIPQNMQHTLPDLFRTTPAFPTNNVVVKPIYIAAARGDIATTELLLRHGATPYFTRHFPEGLLSPDIEDLLQRYRDDDKRRNQSRSKIFVNALTSPWKKPIDPETGNEQVYINQGGGTNIWRLASDQIFRYMDRKGFGINSDSTSLISRFEDPIDEGDHIKRMFNPAP